MLLLKCFCWLQEAASTAAAEAQSTLQAAEEAAKSADAAATEVADAAAAKAMEEYDNLRRVLDAVNAQKAELEGKLAKAGGALNAAEELKEARWADNTSHNCTHCTGPVTSAACLARCCLIAPKQTAVSGKIQIMPNSHD